MSKNVILDQLLWYIKRPYAVPLLLWIIAIGIVICGMLLISQNRVFERTARGFMKAVEATKDRAEKRIEEEERLQQEVGNREKRNFLYCMDEMLYHAGIKEKLSWVTVEVLVLVVGAVMLAVFFLAMRFTGIFVVGFFGAAVVFGVVSMLLKVMCYIRDRKVENSLLQFANLIENYSRTSDDIVGIFGKVYRYLDEPLRTGVAECYSEARTTGSFSKACTRLAKIIGNKQLTTLLSNIEICARHEANYETVTKANKKIIREYLAEKELRREMANNARVQVGVMLVVGTAIVAMLNQMTSGLLVESLLYTRIGNVILAGTLGFCVFAFSTLVTIGQD